MLEPNVQNHLGRQLRELFDRLAAERRAGRALPAKPCEQMLKPGSTALGRTR